MGPREGLKGRPVRWSTMVGLLLSAAMVVACEPGDDPGSQVEGSSEMAVTLGALKSSCSASDANPVQVVDQFRVCGEAPLQLDKGGTVIRKLFDSTFGAQAGIAVDRVAANDLYEVTVVGLVGGKPKYFARSKNVSVRVDATTALEMVLAPFNDVACIDMKTVGKPTHRVFPASVRLSDGRVFVSGGFAAVTTDGGTPVLTQPQDKSWFFDPKTGTVSEGPTLTHARGAHAAIYIASQKKVVLIGGATKLPFSDNPDKLGLQYDAQNALNTIEIIDVSTKGKEQIVTGDLQMMLKRVFPVVVPLGSSEVLITGGGNWPESKSDFKEAELFNAKSNELASTVTVTDFAPRAGHTLTFVKNETISGATVEVFLAWGGTTTDHKAAFLLNTRGLEQSQPTFATAVFTSDSASFDRTYFHSMTPLEGDRFLALGGVALDGSDLSKVDATQAYLVSYSMTDGKRTLKVEEIGGFPKGRWAHTATSHDGKQVAIVGGFTGLNGDGSDQVVYFDGDTQKFSTSPQPPAFAPRGGHTATLLQDDALYLAGGIQTTADLAGTEVVLSDVYVPGNVVYCTAAKPAEGEGQ